MVRNNCTKEKCKFYDAFSEYAIDCCMFGTSALDAEQEKGCSVADDYDFYIETFDEDEGMRIQFHYWSKGNRFFSSIVREDNKVLSKTKRISEERFKSALEELHNA